jgi:hypothetical protein
MEIPEEIILGIKAKQGVAEALREQISGLAGESLEMGRQLEKALKPEKFPKNYLVPLCLNIQSLTGLWITALGGSESVFEELRERQIEQRNEYDEYLRREIAAKQALWDYVDLYLRTVDPVYRERSEVFAVLKKINETVGPLQSAINRVVCDLIGVDKPVKIKSILEPGMKQARQALSELLPVIEPYQRFLASVSDDELVYSYGKKFTNLYGRLAGCTLQSESVDGAKRELEIILHILERISGLLVNSERLEEALTRKINVTIDRDVFGGKRES